MAYYLIQVAYTPEAWAAMLEEPQNRMRAVQPAAEGLGGSIDGAFLSFGDYDLVASVEMPDNVSAAALAMAIAAGGGVRDIKTTPLLSLEEGAEAMGKAAGSGYSPPGA
jgi:uncharacterized protein with GYD domain